jgi:hypothetical protein
MPRPIDFVTKRRVEVCKEKMHKTSVPSQLFLFTSLSLSLSLSLSQSTSNWVRDEIRGAEHRFGHTPERSGSIPRAPGRKQRCITIGKGGRGCERGKEGRPEGLP